MDIYFSRLTAQQLIFLMIAFLPSVVLPFYLLNYSAYWITLGTISALSLLQITEIQKRLPIMVLTGAAIAVIVFISGFINSTYASIIFILFISTGAIWLAQRYAEYENAFYSIIVFTIVCANPIPIQETSLQRGLFSFIGFSIPFLLSLKPLSILHKRQETLAIYAALRSLKQFNNEMFACLSSEYAENVYLFEHRLHNQKMKYMDAISELISLKSADQHIIEICNVIFTNIIEASQLRWRVSDPSTFELCQNEFKALNAGFNILFDTLIKRYTLKKKLPLISLDGPIDQLEDNYQNVLQIAAREPFVFLLFANTLKRLQGNLYALYQTA